jgi:hypothetical protein
VGKRNFIDFGFDKLGLTNGHYLMQWELGMDFAIATNRELPFSNQLAFDYMSFSATFFIAILNIKKIIWGYQVN